MNAIVIYVRIGWFAAPFVAWIEKYVYSDWEFLKFLSVIVSVDTFLGLIKAIMERKVSSKGFGMVLKKLLIYTSLLIYYISTHQVYCQRCITGGIFFSEQYRFLSHHGQRGNQHFRECNRIEPGVLLASILKYLQKFHSEAEQKLSDEGLDNTGNHKA